MPPQSHRQRNASDQDVPKRRRLDIVAMSVEEVAQIKDPFKRAITAKIAYDLHAELAQTFSSLRRQTIRSMNKDENIPLAQIAQELGITVVAASGLSNKAGGHRPASPRWWDRVPDGVASKAKRGPGGISPDKVIASDELVAAVTAVMRAGGPRKTYRPIDLLNKASRRLKRTVPHSSFRAALRKAETQGLIRHVGRAEYVLSKAGCRR